MIEKYLEQYRFLIIGALVAIIAVGIYLIFQPTKQATTSQEKLVVDISGAVKKPGVYYFDSGSRVVDAIKKAGGFKKKADLDQVSQEINQAELLSDEQKIYVPFRESSSGAVASAENSSEGATTSPVSGKVNINTANASQLATLPGIGSAYASRIIQYRTTNGSFQSVDQLTEVSGIGPKTLEKLRPLVSI